MCSNITQRKSYLANLLDSGNDLHGSSEGQLLDSFCSMTIFLSETEQARNFAPSREKIRQEGSNLICNLERVTNLSMIIF